MEQHLVWQKTCDGWCVTVFEHIAGCLVYKEWYVTKNPPTYIRRAC